ncbi:hypothetical protein DID88_005361 [Monilinia fructigena]|uniref:Mitosis protein dim1 n=1 Tax=Monilinia fructigena TaxID=38457 RepID=A0A395J1X6_9HELO|nr:hypothetical protein DID88_005361 [Monilinia fructigena]
MGSVVLPHLVTGWHVDQAIMSEEERLVVIRFGRDVDPDCMRQDEVLYKVAELFGLLALRIIQPGTDTEIQGNEKVCEISQDQVNSYFLFKFT